MYSSINCGKVTPTYNWSIKEFGRRCRTFGDHILSPQFSLGINNELSWQLQIYPYGELKRNYGYLSIYLLSKNDFTVKALCELTIEDADNFNREFEQIFEPKSGNGYRHFIRRNNINGLNQRGHTFTVKCEFHKVTIIKNPHDSRIYDSKLEVLNDIRYLFMNKDFYDVTIKANTKEFQAHKLILSARSKVFAAMFNHEMIENIENTVEIEDIDPEVLEVMLKYIYTGEVNVTKKITKELLIAADKYAIDGLKNICITEIENTTLKIDNAIDLLLFANRYNLYKFKKSIVDFILANAKHIIHKPEFNLLKDMPEVLVELFSKQTQNQD